MWNGRREGGVYSNLPSATLVHVQQNEWIAYICKSHKGWGYIADATSFVVARSEGEMSRARMPWLSFFQIRVGLSVGPQKR
jgi:hypothetical protein